MKKFFSLFILASIFFNSCGKENSPAEFPVAESKLQYDTTAIDSFSNGAISVDVARQIRMSSQKYVDSVQEVIRLEKENKAIEEALLKEKKAKDEKKKAEKKNEIQPESDQTTQ